MIDVELEWSGDKKPWVARITGRCKKFGLQRVFMPRIVADESRACKDGRGTIFSFALEGGIYEVCVPGLEGERAKERYFMRVVGDTQQRLSWRQVRAVV